MAIRDLLKKRDKIQDQGNRNTVSRLPQDQSQQEDLSAAQPEFRFLRSTTSTQEVISPPTYPEDSLPLPVTPTSDASDRSPRRHLYGGLNFRRPSRSPAKSNTSSTVDSDAEQATTHDGASDRSRRVSAKLERMHLTPKSRTVSQTSTHVPDDLPEIGRSGADSNGAEADWEKRALLLANKNATGIDTNTREASTDISLEKDGVLETTDDLHATKPKHSRSVSNPEADLDIQEAIRLHEAGELERATTLFRRLASPTGHDNALAQVMYGLSLRHGWGCVVSPSESLKYLSLAAANSAGVESAALSAGKVKGGAAKGELVLATYELGNSFRYGLGCERDPIAARLYYETAAELGDTDAMIEVAWCYLEGCGGKKDKFKAARFLRTAEGKGIKEAGNSWIWKEKYNKPSKAAS